MSAFTRRIVVVEDNDDHAMLIERVLRQQPGVEIVRFDDGPAALAHLTDQGQPAPDLVLLDVKLTTTDGFEVLRDLRASARGRGLPVVMLTTSRADPDVRRAYDLGANSYVTKPFDFKEFQATLREVGVYWGTINEPPRT